MSSGYARRLAHLGDPRILVGLAITAVTLWFVLRDVDFGEVLANIATGNFVYLFASVFTEHF